jgi:hypothetical protein
MLPIFGKKNSQWIGYGLGLILSVGVSACSGGRSSGGAAGSTDPGLPSPSASSTPSLPTDPDRLEIVSGDAQAAGVASALPSPVVVRVLAVNGSPLAGITLRFTASLGVSSIPLP